MSELIRLAVEDDAPALAALGKTTFIETFVEGFGIPYPPDDIAHYFAKAFDPEVLRARILDHQEAWWVAERAGEVLAFANAGPNTLPHPDGRPTHAELRRLYVARRAQGFGFGTRLLTTALSWMEAHTDGPLWIGVWSGNLKAQKLYGAYGFGKVGDYQFPVGNWLDDEFILRRG